jgi:hypothetical protein
VEFPTVRAATVQVVDATLRGPEQLLEFNAGLVDRMKARQSPGGRRLTVDHRMGAEWRNSLHDATTPTLGPSGAFGNGGRSRRRLADSADLRSPGPATLRAWADEPVKATGIGRLSMGGPRW